MADDRDEQPVEPEPEPAPRDDEASRHGFALVRPYIASLGEPVASESVSGWGSTISMDPGDHATVRLDRVPSSDADTILDLDTRGRHRRARRSGLYALAGLLVAATLTGGYLFWTPAASPAGLIVMPGPAPLPDFSAAGPRPSPSVSGTPPTTVHSSRSRSATPSGPPSAPASSPRGPAVASTPALAGSPSSPSSSPSESSAPPLPSGPTAITGPGGVCLDDNLASTDNGNKIQMYACNGTPAQQWTLPSDGTLQVVGKCLRTTGDSPGSLVVLWDCIGGDSEVWRPGRGNSFVNPASGLCLDDPGEATSDGTWVQIATCTDGTSQSWTVH